MTKKFLFAAMGAAFATMAIANPPQLNYVKQIQPGNLLNQHIAAVAVDGNNLYVAGYRNSTVNGPVSVTRVSNWNTSNAAVAWSIQLGDGTNPQDQIGNRDTDLVLNGNDLYVGTSLGEGSSNWRKLYRLNTADGTLVLGNLSDPLGLGWLVFNDIGATNWQKIGLDNGFNGSGPISLAGMNLDNGVLRRLGLPGGTLSTPGDAAGILPNPAVDMTGASVIRSSSIRDFVITSTGDVFYRTDNRAGANTAGIYQMVRANANGFTNPVVRRALVPITGTGLQFLSLEYVPAGPGYSEFFLVNNRDLTNPNRFEVWRAGVTGTNGSFFAAYDGGAEGLSVNNRPWRYDTAVQNFAWQDNANGTRYIFVTGFKADDVNTNPARLSKQTVDIYQIGDAGKITVNISLPNYDGASGARTIPVQIRDAVTNQVLDARNLVTTGTPSNSATITFFTTARGNVKITTKPSGFLRRTAEVNVGATPLNVNLALPAGDVDASGEIDLTDIDLIIGKYLNSAPDPLLTPEDVDGSGEVDLTDIDIAIGNYLDADQ